jgi:hypothetical protein
MLERGIFVAAAACLAKCIVQGLFQFASETGHLEAPGPSGEKAVGTLSYVGNEGRLIKGTKDVFVLVPIA